MTRLWIDLETIATLPVTTNGLYRHCEDPTLDITLAVWGLDDAPLCLWWSGYPKVGTTSVCPDDLEVLLTNPQVICYAHNAAYERRVIKAVWDIDIPPERWRCTAVIARWFNLPAKLDGFTSYMLGKSLKKLDLSHAAKLLWNTASLPWDEDDLDLFHDEMIPYGLRDVESMRQAVMALPPLPDAVWEEYAANERINDRGVAIDLAFSREATLLRKITDNETKAALSRMTGGEVTTPRGPSPRVWMEKHLPKGCPLLDEEGQLTRGFKKRRTDRVGFYTETKPTFDRTMRAKVREYAEEITDYTALDFLDLIDEGQNAAITKFAAANGKTSSDGRLRGMYIFAGAAQTHRFSSGDVQTHNLLRDTLSLDDDLALRTVLTASQRPLEARLAEIRSMTPVKEHGLSRTLSMAVRGTLMSKNPKTHDLYWADWSAVEARGLPWLANDGRKLQMFRDGVDPYIVNASDLYGIRMSEVTKQQRQVGKVQELALGYGGGKGAFIAMSRGYGVVLSPEQVKEAVTSWRANNPTIVEFWGQLEDAAFEAMRRPITPIPVGNGLHYLFAPNVAFGSLLLAMPCGGMLVYPNARIEEVERFEDQPPEPAICFDHPTYGRTSFWHGLQTENATQAICASLLRDKLVIAEQEGHEIVAHTHDEIVGEAHTDDAEDKMSDLIAIMTEPTDWSGDLPLDAEGGIGSRYKIEEACY